MPEFRIGDLVRVVGFHPLACYTGIVTDRDESKHYLVEIRQTGLFYIFAESNLELIQGAAAKV